MKRYEKKFNEDYANNESFTLNIKQDDDEILEGLSTVTLSFNSQGKSKLLFQKINVPYNKISKIMFDLKNKI